jgi:hypothetical protein
MKCRNSPTVLVQILCMLLLSLTVNFVFAQNPEKRGQKGRKTQERSIDINPGKSPLPEVSNGNIVMGSPTASSITASIILEQGSEAFIQYTNIDGKKTKYTAHFYSKNGEPFEIKLNNLESNAIYSYRLNFRLPNEKEFRQTRLSGFPTQKKQNKTFSFGVQGDSHPEREGKMFNPLLYCITLDSVIQKRPDFYFLMGDDFSIDRLMVNNQADKEKVDRVYLTQRSWLGNSGAMPPLFLVNGNHEQAAKYLLDGTENSAAVVAANARKRYFPLPEPSDFYGGDKDTVAHIGYIKDYYSFEWGNALFVVIDPYWHSDIPVDNQPGSQEKRNRKDPWGITIGDEQYIWLKNTLEKSNAKFKFVFSHHVLGTGRGGVEVAKLFEWGGYDRNGIWEFEKYRPNWAMPIHQLMVKNKVTIFFQGHDHLFARQELDGIIYQSVPNPADDTYTAFNRDAYKSGVILPNSGFLFVTVGAHEVKVDYIRSYLKESPLLTDDAKTAYSYLIK